jgi:hypothetical protein
MESFSFRALDISFGILPNFTYAIGIDEGCVAKAEFPKSWEYSYCKQISRILRCQYAAHFYEIEYVKKKAQRQVCRWALR